MFVSEVQANSVVEAVAGQQLIHDTWGEITALLEAQRTDDAAVRQHAEYASLLGPDAMERMVRNPRGPPSVMTPACRPRWLSNVRVTHRLSRLEWTAARASETAGTATRASPCMYLAACAPTSTVRSRAKF